MFLRPFGYIQDRFDGKWGGTVLYGQKDKRGDFESAPNSPLIRNHSQNYLNQFFPFVSPGQSSVLNDEAGRFLELNRFPSAMFVHANLTTTGFGAAGLETTTVSSSIIAVALTKFLSTPAMIKFLSGPFFAIRPLAVWSKNNRIVFRSIFIDLYNGLNQYIKAKML